MPITPTYPGVYIDEVPSGVKTIVGTSTAITAFVGSSVKGPVSEPITIYNYADYQRIFGGLDNKHKMSFAVQDYFLNGGQQAIIVRVAAAGIKVSEAALEPVDSANAGKIKIQAVNGGLWGDNLTVEVKTVANLPADYVSVKDKYFALVVKYNAVQVESYPLVTTIKTDTKNYLGNVLAASEYIRAVVLADSIALKPDVAATLAAGADGAVVAAADIKGVDADKTGMYALRKVDLFTILCIAPYTNAGDVDKDVVATAAKLCEEERAFLLLDAPSTWINRKAAKDGIAAGDLGTTSAYAAVFFPRVVKTNPLTRQDEVSSVIGTIAGVIARTDLQRGIWKSPAGLETALVGVNSLAVQLTDPEIGELNPLGINCLRKAPGAGNVVWGARTLQGNDLLSSDWKYIAVRRIASYIEENLYRGIQFAVFEPNDEPLWSQIRTTVGKFMDGLFRQGAFQGSTPNQAYFVRCGSNTTTQTDIDKGIVNVEVGFAPLKPAEFVIIKIQQKTNTQ